MTVAASLFRFEDSYARAVPGLYVPWTADSAPGPELLVLNAELAVELPQAATTSTMPAISSAFTCPASGTAARCCSAR